MSNQSFPPIVLTHITLNNILPYGACNSGIHEFLEKHNLSHLTAVPVSLLLQSKQLTIETKNWVKFIAGLNLKNSDRKGYGYGADDGYGDGHGDGNGDDDGNGEEYGTEEGYGCRSGYAGGNGFGSGDGTNYGDGYKTGDGHGGVTRYGNQSDNQTL